MLERAAGDRRVGWVSLLGLLLVPLVVAAGFLYATWQSDTRLDRVQGAIVNLDEPVRLDGQLVPLGRQLAGGLVTGGDTADRGQNFDWVLTDATDAGDGLASGRYAAVVTIPTDFSARATSFSKSQPGEIAPAQLDVQTSQSGGIVDPVISQAIATAATSSLNTELTKQYLDNIYVGFNTTGKQFTTVAKAAGDLSTGTTKLADGLDELDTGTGQLATGAKKLSTGLDQLSRGTSALPKQTRKLADGADASADGAAKLAKGAKQLHRGLSAYADGTGEAATGASKFSQGLTDYTDGVQGLNSGLHQYAGAVRTLATDDPPAQVVRQLCPAGTPDEVCSGLKQAFQAGAGAALQGLETKSDGETLLSGAQKLADNSPAIATGGRKIAGGLTKLDRGAERLEQGSQGLASGTTKFAGGLRKLASGTDRLADGLQPLAGGISRLATGAGELSTGVSKLSDGTGRSADGARKLADGSEKLADGLRKGAEKVPSYDQTTRTRLAEVVATPVQAERPDALFSGVANTTFLAVLALWLGGLVTFLVVRAVPSTVLTSMKSSTRLAAEALAPGAAIAAVQAVALTVALQVMLGLDAGAVAGLLGLLVLAAVAYAAVNQALVAWLGGIGRLLSIVAVVVSAASALTAARPPVLSAALPYLPMTPALEGARAIATGAPGALGATGLLVAWLVVGLAFGVLAIARRRILPVPVVTAAHS